MKENFHTHTFRCFHAAGTDEDYVRAAVDNGFTRLGFADHAPWRYQSDFVSSIRMHANDFPGYRDAILALKKQYAGQIDIRLGLEMEYFPRYFDQLRCLQDEGVEYFILGQHYLESDEDHPYIPNITNTDDGLMAYAESIAQALSTGMYCYAAHPDLFMRRRTDFTPACEKATEIICQAARENDVPIEYNLLGLNSILIGQSRSYPCSAFWQHASGLGVRAILGIDAHAPESLARTDLWDMGIKNLTDMGFTIQHTIPLADA